MENESFTIDTTPEICQNFQVPRYQVGRKSVELVKHEEHSNVRGCRNQSNTATNQCWNCGRTNHSIRECPFVVNPITLEWNRELQTISRNYQNKRFQKGARYHQTDKLAENYSHVKPGTVSASLKHALGLSDSELPAYIYRLRRHGYPKAWLKHATVRPSGMNLYDAQGNEMADPDAEDGEIVDEEDKIRYDLDKLIQFPGFNAPMPENVVDECDKFGADRYDVDQSLESMIRTLKEKALPEYRLKKKREPDRTVTTSDASKEDKNSIVDQLSNSISPSDNSTSEGENPPASSCVLKDDDAATSPDSNKTLPAVPDGSSSSADAEDLSSPQPSPSPQSSSFGRVLSRTIGTPLLASRSGHSRLPPPENFSKDICDVINFENLPESTGKFESMRGLLRKVKQILGFQRNASA